jgi:hypothetical protein
MRTFCKNSTRDYSLVDAFYRTAFTTTSTSSDFSSVVPLMKTSTGRPLTSHSNGVEFFNLLNVTSYTSIRGVVAL